MEDSAFLWGTKVARVVPGGHRVGGVFNAQFQQNNKTFTSARPTHHFNPFEALTPPLSDDPPRVFHTGWIALSTYPRNPRTVCGRNKGRQGPSVVFYYSKGLSYLVQQFSIIHETRWCGIRSQRCHSPTDLWTEEIFHFSPSDWWNSKVQSFSPSCGQTTLLGHTI